MIIKLNSIQLLLSVFIFLLVLFSLVIQFPGTGDVKVWSLWINNAMKYGVNQGYSHSGNMDYPPLSFALLFYNNQFLNNFNLGFLTSLKVMLFFFLIMTGGIFYLITKKVELTVLLVLSLFLESVALGYLDILFAPLLIFSLYALKKEQYSLFSLFYTASFFIKWQPLIIAPFLIIWLVSKTVAKQGNRSLFLLKEIILPSLLFSLLLYLLFGDTMTLSLVYTTSQKFFSGSALNFNWIVTYFLHIQNPTVYGSLTNGLNTYLLFDNSPIFKFIKYLFYFGYILIVIKYLFEKKNFIKTISYSVVGFLTYFMFNFGVHENHLFVVVILLAILSSEGKKYFNQFILWAIILNINLLLFFGFTGQGFGFRSIWGIDLSVLISATVFIIFLKLYFSVFPNLFEIINNIQRIKNTLIKPI